MRPWQPWSIRFLVLPLAVAAGLWGSAPAAAGCSWKFNWSCPSCGKIGGATSGAQGGYPSKSACEAARRGANSAVSTSSCVQVGTCDGTVTRQPPPDDDYLRRQEEEARRQEEARAKEAAERKAREQAAFEKSKGELLGQLKGGTLGSGGLKGSGGETRKLKSGTPTFGIKGNPGGDLQLKQPGGAKVDNPETAMIDPSFFTRPKARLRIRSVPNPKEAPRGTWLRYVKSDRAGLILDALEDANGDLDGAIAYLDGQVVRHGAMRKALAALSYLEGLKTSYIAAGVEYRKQAKAPGAPATVESKALLEAVVGSAMHQWPGPRNPNPQPNKNDWRVRRTTAMLQALEENPGDMAGAARRLKGARDRETADNAEYYLRGVYAYWDYLGTRRSR